MTEFVQLHFLTAYPPANLNRDDTGRPKSAVVGGHPRLRISSQALKRAWRGSDVFAERVGAHRGIRTQRLGEKIEERLLAGGMDEKEARETARKIADLFGKTRKDADAHPAWIEQLAFISPEEWQRAEALADKALAGEPVEAKASDILGRADSAVDIAMFGRMLADDPAFNREAAVQVAHAFTTHRVMIEDDFYSAIDDLNDPRSETFDNTGAAFLDVQGFGAGVFYLYLCIDTASLLRNLDGEAGPARDGVSALVEAAATVAPKGKQASFASRAYASYILCERGEDQPRNLFSAYLAPVGGGDILGESVERLEEFRTRLGGCFGSETEAARMNAARGQGSLEEILRHATAFAA